VDSPCWLVDLWILETGSTNRLWMTSEVLVTCDARDCSLELRISCLVATLLSTEHYSEGFQKCSSCSLHGFGKDVSMADISPLRSIAVRISENTLCIGSMCAHASLSYTATSIPRRVFS
jgi:hypothetical protein